MVGGGKPLPAKTQNDHIRKHDLGKQHTHGQSDLYNRNTVTENMIHQFWEGKMPENIARLVEKIRAKTEEKHRLWNWATLTAEFSGETARRIEKAKKQLPPAKWASLASDWARFCLCAHRAGLWLDTDTIFTEENIAKAKQTILRLPPGLYGGRERFNPNLPNSCLLWVKGEKGQAAAQAALQAAETRLAALLNDKESVDGIANGKISLCDVIGPRWLRRTLGQAFSPLPENLASSHNPTSIFFHKGMGSWLKNDANSPKTHTAQPSAKRTRPAWLTPCGNMLLPEKNTGGTARAPLWHTPCTTTTQPEKNPFGLPLATIRKATRIIILSNITQGFSPEDLPILPGDLVCHCNRAVHFSATRSVPNTQHWLFVRSGKTEKGRKWYTPKDFDGFHRIRFIDDRTHVHPQNWHQEYKKKGGTSPTTGFIVANTLHSLAPEKPIILAGFDPAVPHGTPLWSGHNWQLEKQWYKEKMAHNSTPLLKN